MKAARLKQVAALRPVPSVAPLPAPEPTLHLPVVATASVTAIDGRVARVQVGGAAREAELDPSVHPIVIAGACARGERVLVEQRGDAWFVVGALRTQPTPGVDAADRYVIRAGAVELEAEEISLKTQAAALVLRAQGEIETYAERIVSRAEGLHKIVARMLRLN